MRIIKSIITVSLIALPLAGCLQDPATRGAAGAAAGAVIADVTDNSAVTGAVIGGLAGAASCTLPGQG